MKITFENVVKRFDRAVLDDCTLQFADGKITALLGESGRGKTTVLRLIAGLETPDAGSVRADGRVAYLFQEPRLFPALTAFENVRLAAPQHDRAAAQNALAVCRAAHLAEKRPAEMSGGERQRVALARMLAFDGEIVLLDEPFSALDPETKAQITAALLPRLQGKTVVLVTHNAEEAALADAVLRL